MNENQSETTVLKPQIRDLWQCKEVAEQARNRFSETFGIPFGVGTDGICLRQSRRMESGSWRISADGEVCVIDFSDNASLCAAFDEAARLLRFENGILSIPNGTVSSENK